MALKTSKIVWVDRGKLLRKKSIRIFDFFLDFLTFCDFLNFFVRGHLTFIRLFDFFVTFSKLYEISFESFPLGLDTRISFHFQGPSLF